MASFDQTIRIQNSLLRCMLSEFFGTFLLIFIAHSTGSAYSLASNGSTDKVAKIGAATFGVGCAALIALTTAMPVSGGHINPAITLAVATIGHFPWTRVIPYIIAQHAGGFAAAAAIYLTFYDNIQATQVAFNGTEGLHKTAHMFTSLPPASTSLFASFVGSFWGTAVFLFGIAAILDQKSSMKPPKWYWPLGVSFVLMISLAAFGANGGPNVNPAADFPTRIFASCVGWSSILWQGSWWAVIGLLAPHLGAIFALWVYRICIAAHYPDEEEDAQDTHELRQLQEKRP